MRTSPIPAAVSDSVLECIPPQRSNQAPAALPRAQRSSSYTKSRNSDTRKRANEISRIDSFEEAGSIFDRMLWLNPSDNQGVRFLIDQVRAKAKWEDGR